MKQFIYETQPFPFEIQQPGKKLGFVITRLAALAGGGLLLAFVVKSLAVSAILACIVLGLCIYGIKTTK